MKQPLLKKLLTVALMVFGLFNVQAQTLASWNFAGEPGNQEFTAGTGSTNVIPLNLTRGADITATTAGNSISSAGWDAGENRYFSFGITIDEGFQAKLSKLIIGTRSSGTGPGEMALTYSMDGFTNNLATWVQVGTNFNNQEIDLSALPLLTENVEFRIVSSSNVSANGGTVSTTGTFRVTNFFPGDLAVSLNGEVTPINDPDPETAATLAQWDFAGQPGNQEFTAGTGSINIDAKNFGRGTGIIPTTANNSISGSSWSTEANDYFTFGITIASGFEVELQNLVIATRSSNTGPGDLSLRYSIDNFGSDLAQWTNSGSNFSNETLDLSNIGLISGDVEFRVVATSNRAANNSEIQTAGTLRVGNFFVSSGNFLPVQFNGTIREIPPLEPEVILNYNFTGEPGNQISTGAELVTDGLTALDFARGTDIGPTGANNSISSNGWDSGAERFFTFGFTVAPDKLVDLSNLKLGTRSSNTGPKNLALRYSGDNFSSDLANWEQIGTAFNNQEIDLSVLKNLSGNVEFRIVSTSDVSANGGTVASGGTLRVTNFFPDNVGVSFVGIVKNASGVIVPGINLDPNTLDFGMVTINETAPVLTYEITASNLTADIIINSEGPFIISADGVNFQNTITIPAGQFNNPVSISVALDSSVPGTLSSNITHQTNGAGPVNLTVSATVVDPFNISEDFNNSCPDGLPSGWTSVSLLGDQEWVCTEFGRAGTNEFANAPFGVQMNGFLSGPVLNEDWLISPAYDLSEFDFPILTFWSRANFAGPRLQLLVSTNYVDGDPAQADWTELNDRFATSNTWTFSKEINLVGFKNSNVRIAFKYRSSPVEGATRWTLDDFNLKNSDAPPAPFLTNTIGNVDYWHFGIIPVGTVSIATRTFNFSLSDALEPLTIKAVPGFEFSKNGSDFFQSLTYDPIEAAANNTVTVRFAPNDMGAFSGNIAFESGDIMIQRGFVTGATVERDNTFDIVTWNVEWFGSTQPRQGPNDVDLQLQNVKTIVEDLDADVYAFQEITGLDKFNELVELLEEYEAVVSPAASQGPDVFDDAQKLIFLYKKEVVELVKTRVLLEGVNPEDLVGYPSTPDRFWASGRLPFMMEIKANIDGIQQKFNLVNVHTRSNGGGESAANPRYAMRRYDVNVLKDSLDFYYGDVPLILFGDFNDDLDETVADQTAPTVNTSETSFINYINDLENYIPVTLSLSNAGLRTFPSFEDVIDHMIISDELESNWIVNSERAVAPFDLITNYLSTTSDHLPVKARFKLRCDIIAGQIIAPNEVCAESEFNLLFVGGEFTNIVAWEISTDNGMTWEPIEGSDGKNEITISAINASASFRVLMESNLCFAYSDVSETALVELPEPVIYFERGLLNTIQGDYTYYWYKNDVLISTTTVNATRIQGAGNYEVVIENELGCQSISETFRFPQQMRNSSVRVFPNPSSHLVTVIAKNTEGLINVELLSSAGVKITSKITDEGFVEFDVSGLSKGIYLIVITDRNGHSTVERLLVK
ncbi:endonuclease/exonuclease/phosphatase family protein [Aquiflexum lacus]|uniref:endonuclease/exonuclease/phosphatase family protein n=1 Tax=Aquiflexum lacus TaxID=2483805 RepID=UPI001895273C|nr:endonuclease/exonuclease/phosphatase family protein [Aquiflexum lacus]